MTHLEDAQTHLEALQGIAEVVVTEITEKDNQLTSLQTKVDEKQRDLDALNVSLEELETNYSKRKKELDESISELTEKEAKTAQRVLENVDKVANLKLEQGKLIESNDKFKTYEEKAMKVLNAKDKELLARANTLSERENMTPQTKTLLPKLGD